MSHVAWLVCLCGYLCVGLFGYTCELCKNGWNDRDAVWGLTHVCPKNQVPDGDKKVRFWGGARCNVPAHECVATAAGECACPCSAHSGRMHSTSLGMKSRERRGGLLRNYLVHLFLMSLTDKCTYKLCVEINRSYLLTSRFSEGSRFNTKTHRHGPPAT